MSNLDLIGYSDFMANTYSKLEAARKAVAKLEKQVARETAKLLKLPAKYGFKTPADFMAAFKAAADGGDRVGNGLKPRGRAKITPEIKAAVKKLVGEEKTGAEIAAALKISVPSVANIKKELGLTRTSKR